MKWWRRQVVIGVALTLVLGGVASGDPSLVSPSYRIDESQVGGTGDYGSQSGGYSFIPGTDDGGSTLGDTFAGNSASASYQTNAGFNTTAQPTLTFTVNAPASVNLGLLSSASATFGIATFDVTNYTSYGYQVIMIGSPPTYNSHALAPLTTDTASSAGTEQFGVNLVANTVAGVGANPGAPPSGINSQGVAGNGANNNYAQSDKWRFNSGEVVASAPRSSGATRFTMTFLANISTVNTPVTPASGYTGSLTLVATGTY